MNSVPQKPICKKCGFEMRPGAVEKKSKLISTIYECHSCGHTCSIETPQAIEQIND